MEKNPNLSEVAIHKYFKEKRLTKFIQSSRNLTSVLLFTICSQFITFITNPNLTKRTDSELHCDDMISSSFFFFLQLSSDKKSKLEIGQQLTTTRCSNFLYIILPIPQFSYAKRSICITSECYTYHSLVTGTFPANT